MRCMMPILFYNAVPGILTGCIVPFNAEFQWFRLLICGLTYESKCLLCGFTFVFD